MLRTLFFFSAYPPPKYEAVNEEVESGDQYRRFSWKWRHVMENVNNVTGRKIY